MIIKLSLLTTGALFLLISIINKVRAHHTKPDTSGKYLRICMGLTGILLIAFSFTLKKLPFSSNSTINHDKETIVRVYPFLQQKDDPDISWVSITAERKVIELFANSGVDVLSHITRFQTSAEPFYHIKGSVYKKDSLVTAVIGLLNKKGVEIASGELVGTIEFFHKVRNVIGETLIYALDINKHNLVKRKTKKMPSYSNHAFALYLLARRKLLAEKHDSAIRLLLKATEEDPKFAMAYWTISQIYREMGIKDSTGLWDKKAKMIDADYPRWSYKDTIDKEQPLKDLLKVSGKQQFITIDKGIIYKHIKLKQYDFTAIIWIIDLQFFTIDMQLQNKITGNYIEEFFYDKEVILALNGGFFEMDNQHRLSPSGLIIKNGKVISPITGHGGSGVFCIKNRKPDIIWSKESINPGEYEVAFQSGPVIVEHGGVLGVYNNDYKRLNRSAIGISDNKVVLAILVGENGRGLSLYEFAQFLLIPKNKGGAGCDAALNLDGGASTQVCFSFKNVAININGLWAINSAVVVKGKKQ